MLFPMLSASPFDKRDFSAIVDDFDDYLPIYVVLFY